MQIMPEKPCNIRNCIYVDVKDTINTNKFMNINKKTIQLSENLYYNNYKIYLNN
jgi:hypothetical protein